jgi:DNA-binding transcriptional ArsR family regulator
MLDALDMQDDSAARAADFLRTLGHARRLRIVCALINGEQSAGALALHARLPRPALSQHAAILESKHIICRERQGRSVHYRLSSREARALAKLVYRMFRASPTVPAAAAGVKSRQSAWKDIP